MRSFENIGLQRLQDVIRGHAGGKARLELSRIRSYQLSVISCLKKFTCLAIALTAVFRLADQCEAAEYRVRKSAEGLTFDIYINRNPPVLGDNQIRIEIRDSQGNPVLDAEVLVNYYMPPMPNMAPMNYTIPASLKDKEYRATMDLIMTGPWNIVTRVKIQGRWIRVVFPIDVR